MTINFDPIQIASDILAPLVSWLLWGATFLGLIAYVVIGYIIIAMLLDHFTGWRERRAARRRNHAHRR